MKTNYYIIGSTDQSNKDLVYAINHAPGDYGTVNRDSIEYGVYSNVLETIYVYPGSKTPNFKKIETTSQTRNIVFITHDLSKAANEEELEALMKKAKEELPVGAEIYLIGVRGTEITAEDQQQLAKYNNSPYINKVLFTDTNDDDSPKQLRAQLIKKNNLERALDLVRQSSPLETALNSLKSLDPTYQDKFGDDAFDLVIALQSNKIPMEKCQAITGFQQQSLKNINTTRRAIIKDRLMSLGGANLVSLILGGLTLAVAFPLATAFLSPLGGFLVGLAAAAVVTAVAEVCQGAVLAVSFKRSNDFFNNKAARNAITGFSENLSDENNFGCTAFSEM